MQELASTQADEFTAIVWRYFDTHRRDMPWRKPRPDGRFDPYAIMVSELMLQQTQVVRVVPKYEAFLKVFPDAAVLASAELGEVLRLWSGLGYNRRAKFLWQAAAMVTTDLGGSFPRDEAGLVRLPGVGKNTAGAILAYAYDEPAVFIETNIRSVLIHHFFEAEDSVLDNRLSEILAPLVPERSHPPGRGPREWYWALMDYGAHLKATTGNAARRSRHYVRQAPLKGSLREIRGKVLRLLGEGSHPLPAIREHIDDDRLADVIAALEAEGLISRNESLYRLG